MSNSFYNGYGSKHLERGHQNTRVKEHAIGQYDPKAHTSSHDQHLGHHYQTPTSPTHRGQLKGSTTKQHQYNEYQTILYHMREQISPSRSTSHSQSRARKVKVELGEDLVQAFEANYTNLHYMLSDEKQRQISPQVYDAKVEDYKDYIQQLKGKNKDLEKKLEHQSEQSKMLAKASSQLSSEITNKIAEQMNSQISMNESNLENISIKNRPMNIAQEYEEICTKEWHTAKEFMDKHLLHGREDIKLDILHRILVNAANEADEQLTQLKGLIGVTESTPTSSLTSVFDALRICADKADVTQIQQATITAIQKIIKDPDILKEPSMKNYLKACAHLAWKMCTQRPKLIFKSEGVDESWNEATQDPFWGSVDPKSARTKVKFYVHPAMYQGDKLLVKGKVLLRRA